MAHRYASKQAEFIRQNVKGRTSNELLRLVNEHFGINLSINQIRAYKKNNGLRSGVDSQFKPGNIPFNKGKKGVGGWEPTQFKKGNKPHNWVPIGSERVSKDGYIQIKIADGKKQKNWKGKHILIWEKENGPVPKGHNIIFGDGNNRNFDPNNLILVSRKQMATLNKRRLIQNDAGLTRTALVIVDIYQKISERKK